MEFVILGPTALNIDGHPVPLGPAKQRGMLALLLYYAGAPVRADLLVDHLWGHQRSRVDHRPNLYALASRIRGVLAKAGVGDVLERINGSGAYRLNVTPAAVDYHVFKHLVATARQAAAQRRFETATDRLATAIALWGGEPLADLRDEQSEQLRHHVTDTLLEAHKLMADCQLVLGQHAHVLAQLEPLMQTHDLDEALAQRWISALCASGREDDARAFLLAFQRRFRKEFRVAPTISIARPASGVRSVVPDAASEKKSARPTWQLPPYTDTFIGHQDLLAELDVLSARFGRGSNAVVLTGMPGVGKTTLAVHWAQHRLERFPDGQLYLDVNGFGPGAAIEPVAALARLIAALDPSANPLPATIEGRRDLLNELLSTRRVLVVLDNVRDSGQVRPLIPTSTRSFILITSRTRLRSLTIREGVRCITVEPLPHPDCLTLLARIIGAHRADAEPDAVRTLAQISSGLPLALRIMAERVAEWPAVPVTDLVDELNQYLLSADAGEDEEASLHSVFAWSYQALRPDVARLFRLLGLAPTSTVSLDAAAAMVAGSLEETHGLVNALTRAHLISLDAVHRYGLHDLLRRYAAARALDEEPADDRHDALRRLLTWYLLSATNAAHTLAPDSLPVPDLPESGTVAPQTFPSDVEAMKWCDAERTNIGLVARWAAQHGFDRYAWQIPGRVHEIYHRYGRRDEVLELDRLALTAARRDGHRPGELGTLINVGATHFALHEYPAAAEHFDEAIRLAREIGDADAEAACLHNLASIYLRTGKTEQAIQTYATVLAICRTIGNAGGEASTLHRLGNAYRHSGRHARAISHYRQALAIRQRIGSLRGQGQTLGELAAAYLASGATNLALEHGKAAIDIDTRTRDDTAHCDALTTMAAAHHALGAPDEAAINAERAVALAEELGDRHRQCLALILLAENLASDNQPDAACEARARAQQLLGEIPAPEAGPLRERLAAGPATPADPPPR